MGLRSRSRYSSCVALLGLASLGCDEHGTVTCAVSSTGCDGTTPPAVLDPEACRDMLFEDVTAAWGVDVVHATTGDCVPQVMGPGGCMFDFDGDHDLDLALFPGKASGAVLLANEGGHFAAVPGAAGLAGSYSGLGCLAFDYDGDFDVDLFVTTTTTQLLFRNDGGSFTDATAPAGLTHPASASSATAGDIDGDGDLDLFVAGFVDGSRCAHPCELGPNTCLPQADTLWENVGGRFVDATAVRGINTRHAALATRFFDLDRDGDLDLWIGSDLGDEPPYYPAQLWLNDGTGHFVEVAAQRGLAVGANGHNGNSMGVDIVDYDLDGVPDLVSSTSRDQPLLLFQCDATGSCADHAADRGLAETTTFFKWAVVFEDFDRDGWPDLFVANGDVDKTPLAEKPGLYWNDRSQFTSRVPPSGDPLLVTGDRRAVLPGDLDGDGLIDLVLTAYNGPVQVLRSRRACGHGLIVQVDHGQAVGARVRVTAGGQTLERQVSASGSFLGSASPDLFFGLDTADRADVEVRWLDGSSEVREGVLADQRVHFMRAPGPTVRAP